MSSSIGIKPGAASQSGILRSASPRRRREIWPVPPVTFTRDGKIDERALDELVEFYVRTGVDGLFVLAYSGEIFELSAEEQLHICRRVVQRAAGRLRIVAAGNFGTDLGRQIEQLNRIAELGPDAVIVLLSTLPDDTCLVQDLCTIAEQVAAPLGVYECPIPVHRLLSAGDVAVLADTGRFVFMKETSRNRISFLAKMRAAQSSPLTLHQANWDQLALTIDDGCPGFCGIIANAFPELVDAFCNLGSLTPAGRQALHQILADALSCITQRHYPATMKYVLQRRGLKLETMSRIASGRNIDAEDVSRLDQALDALSLLSPTDQLLAAISETEKDGQPALRGPYRRVAHKSKALPISGTPGID